MSQPNDLSPRGDIWAVPAMPRAQWEAQTIEVRGAVHKALHNGWSGKLADARRLTGHKPFTIAVAMAAEDLGAPVGQMFTACRLRERAGR